MSGVIPFSVELPEEVHIYIYIYLHSQPLPSEDTEIIRGQAVIDGMNPKVLKEQSLRGMRVSSGLIQRGVERGAERIFRAWRRPLLI